jgi:hypothetical protein
LNANFITKGFCKHLYDSLKNRKVSLINLHLSKLFSAFIMYIKSCLGLVFLLFIILFSIYVFIYFFCSFTSRFLHCHRSCSNLYLSVMKYTDQCFFLSVCCDNRFRTKVRGRTTFANNMNMLRVRFMCWHKIAKLPLLLIISNKYIKSAFYVLKARSKSATLPIISKSKQKCNVLETTSFPVSKVKYALIYIL